MTKAAFILSCLLLAGCARMTQRLTTTVVQPDGQTETKTTRTTAWAFWDAKNSLDKLRVSNGKTHSIGLAGQEQESNSTNFSANLNAAAALIHSLKP